MDICSDTPSGREGKVGMAQAIYSTEDVSFIIAGDVDVAGLYGCALPQRDLQVSAVSCVYLKNSTLLTRNPQA